MPLTRRTTPDVKSARLDVVVVGIGASAGGLEACGKLLDALPPNGGFAFIIVQHLDPNHESLMVSLLASHTAMKVSEAVDGALIEPDHVYVIAPDSYLAVRNGALSVTRPQARHGERMPIDFLLQSMARELGPRAACIVLSGTGTDGSTGLVELKRAGGRVIAQEPAEAAFPGMPQAAIDTGLVDAVVGVAQMGQALRGAVEQPPLQEADHAVEAWLVAIIDLLRKTSLHDFRLYKLGTLQRRTERRMALAAITSRERYLDRLRNDAGERDRLAQDLLINVTQFFRDPDVFSALAEHTIPELIAARSADAPVRLWVAGCSSGEETYSLIMLFIERIEAAKLNLRLQVFASDVDPEAIAAARDGLYPEAIKADVSPQRLARFFTHEEKGFRISSVLRGMVVFTVHDVLLDPPFSRLDFVSCRNLLIYLMPAAQAKAIALFHFALREGGVLLLGGSETIGEAKAYFEQISTKQRIFRRTGKPWAGALRFAVDKSRTRDEAKIAPRPAQLAEFCRRLLIDQFAPAAVLVNEQGECLYAMGPTDRYLRVTGGHPSVDLLDMARDGLRARLKSAIDQGFAGNAPVTVKGGALQREGATRAFDIVAQPVSRDGQKLLLICFIDAPDRGPSMPRVISADESSAIADLQGELAVTQGELVNANRNLEIAQEEQRAINEEALSVNEEHQSTNEELLTSKEELQSLNEELTALNAQLQETLTQQRRTSADLQNVLYSTDVATLFLDPALNIRFFTPATKLLFNVIPSDIGRPLSDLSSLSRDAKLLDGARAVLGSGEPRESEIETRTGAWYARRILPYRTHDGTIDGVVITFVDITDRRRTSEALASAERQAKLADAAKSRFLVAASHDLRQPLQSLTLLQGMLAKHAPSARAQDLVARLGLALGSMSGMLNALLDINQIEAGVIRADIVDVAIGDLLARLARELGFEAQSKGLQLRVVRCSLTVRSDPRLLEQMLRNLISNAMKYTRRGKVLVGCRRRGATIAIEVWDTGIGIAPGEIAKIFDEYHQVGNSARQSSLGLGLGLSIVRRLGALMEHKVSVRSQIGRGSVFAIEALSTPPRPPAAARALPAPLEGAARTGRVLIVEDDPEVSALLVAFLAHEGHAVSAAHDGPAALAQIAAHGFSPDIVLVDYNLPNGMNGLETAAAVLQALARPVPVVVLTGDISTGAMRAIAAEGRLQLNKPVECAELANVIARLLGPALSPSASRRPLVHVIDDDDDVRANLRAVLEADRFDVEDYPSCEAYLAAPHAPREACILVDAALPGMQGLDFLRALPAHGTHPPAIMITGRSDVAMAVAAMKAGAADFIEKPVNGEALIASIGRALDSARDVNAAIEWRAMAAARIAELSPRQREIMTLVLDGHPSKNIAADLNISQRTVENHRASIMTKTGATSLPDLARLVVSAAESPPTAAG